ncbi:MAG TPA: NAD-dependent epimerase/dehydratase family protein [Solirubrobacteraceae bacterium]|nr:NAD-dependent epimerase/dehydratase family protein [Solirubrobacteraceae bacterium]
MSQTLVTGGTGFIGGHIVRQLVQRGDDVVATVRAGARTQDLETLGVRIAAADVLDRRAVRRALKGAARVFHVAGAPALNLARARSFAVNVEGTRIVLEEALRAGVQRVVLTSSVAAIGPAPTGTSADETLPWQAGQHHIPYLDAMHEAELVAQRLAARGLPVVIVNPAHTLGAPAGTAGRLGSSAGVVRAVMRRELPVYVEGTLNVVGVTDVARGHLLADERGAVGERYILGNRNMTVTRLLSNLGRLADVEPPLIRVPLPVALAVAQSARRAGLDALPRAVEIRTAAMNWAVVNRKARRDLGWRPGPHEDCLEATVAWLREHEPRRVARPGTRQPRALRLTGAVMRRAGL